MQQHVLGWLYRSSCDGNLYCIIVSRISFAREALVSKICAVTVIHT
jgi:hypothetical protein